MSYFRLPNNTWMWASTEVSERIFQAGCDPFPELKKTSRLLKWKEFHDNPASGPKHSCVSRLFDAGVHLYFTLGRFRFPAALASVSGLPLSRLLTSPLVNNVVNRQLIHSWGGERPIQFMLHINGLKCSTVIWGRRLSAQSICQEDHTACYQINAGHMEDRRSGTTSKQTRRCVPILW